MQKERVKLFYANDDSNALEKEINEWLEGIGDIEITRALQASSGASNHRVTITIFYKNYKKIIL